MKFREIRFLTQKGYEHNFVQLYEDLILEDDVNVLNDGFGT